MAFQAFIVMEGVSELQRALRTHDKGVRKQVRERFKAVGQIIADQAKVNARAQFKPGTGDLEKKISPRSLTRGVSIVARARHGGYNYPARQEFDTKIGPRPFLFPALEQKKDEAFAELSKVLDWLEREWTVG